MQMCQDIENHLDLSMIKDQQANQTDAEKSKADIVGRERLSADEGRQTPFYDVWSKDSSWSEILVFETPARTYLSTSKFFSAITSFITSRSNPICSKNSTRNDFDISRFDIFDKIGCWWLKKSILHRKMPLRNVRGVFYYIRHSYLEGQVSECQWVARF